MVCTLPVVRWSVHYQWSDEVYIASGQMDWILPVVTWSIHCQWSDGHRSDKVYITSSQIDWILPVVRWSVHCQWSDGVYITSGQMECTLVLYVWCCRH